MWMPERAHLDRVPFTMCAACVQARLLAHQKELWAVVTFPPSLCPTLSIQSQPENSEAAKMFTLKQT